MNCTESLVAKTELTGIYRLESGTKIYTELAVIGKAMQFICDEIETAEREAFIKTAQSYGIELLEQEIYGGGNPGFDLATRRKMLSESMANVNGEFTAAAFYRLLDSFGRDYNVYENTGEQRLVVDIDFTGLSAAQKKRLTQKIANYAPANIEVEIVSSGKSWNRIDSENRTFNAIDADNLTWQQFDNFT